MAEQNGKLGGRKFWALKFVLVLAFLSFILSLVTIIVKPTIAQQVVDLAGSLGTTLLVVGGGYIGAQGVVDYRSVQANAQPAAVAPVPPPAQ
jgi:uncharacterized membrane protein YhaH (DUF805 family)